jgi:hypothetical protein
LSREADDDVSRNPDKRCRAGSTTAAFQRLWRCPG